MNVAFRWLNHTYAPPLVYALIATVILGAGLLPGYVFLLDMPWPEQFAPISTLISNAKPHTPILVLLSIASSIVPSWILQKVILLSILTGSGVTTYYLARTLFKRQSHAYLSGLLAVLNPFVAERLLAGQWIVLAGYAYTPLVILVLLHALKRPSRRNFTILCILYALFPIVSLHWWYIATPVLMLITILSYRGNYATLAKYSSLAIGSCALVNSFWIAQVAGSNGTLRTISTRDFEAFTTASDSVYGVFINVLSLYGFWESSYNQPKVYMSFWWVYGLATFLMALVGSLLVKHTSEASALARTFTYMLPFLIILGIGYAHPSTRIVTDIFRHLPGFSGLRETAKLVGLLALFVALFAPLILRARSIKLSVIFGVVVLLASNGMLLGMRGYMQAYHYPASYRDVASIVQEIDEPIIVLPWTGYLQLNFADNRYVANPAPHYFNATIISSNRTGNGFLDGKSNPLDDVLLHPDRSNWEDALQERGYQYILLLKTDSWNNYQSTLADKEFLYDSPEIALVKL